MRRGVVYGSRSILHSWNRRDGEREIIVAGYAWYASDGAGAWVEAEACRQAATDDRENIGSRPTGD